MINSRALNFSLLISAVISSSSFGEPSNRILQPRNYGGQSPVINQARPVRRVASYGESSYGKARVKKGGALNPNRPTDIRLILMGAISKMGSSDADVQAFRDEQKLGGNIVVGLGADVRFQRYYGLELDTYYGLAPTQTIVFDETETQKKKLQHTGGLFNLKGQYPMYFGKMRFVPKLGVGYGMMSLKQNTESQALADQGLPNTFEMSQSVKGIFGTIGFDIAPVSWLIFYADYATSVSASASASVTSAETSQEVALDGAAFNRLRVGAYVGVTSNVYLGLGLIMRSMSYTVETAEGDTAATTPAPDPTTNPFDISPSEGLTQIAGSILFQF